jgi:hypothetical protein
VSKIGQILGNLLLQPLDCWGIPSCYLVVIELLGTGGGLNLLVLLPAENIVEVLYNKGYPGQAFV